MRLTSCSTTKGREEAPVAFTSVKEVVVAVVKAANAAGNKGRSYAASST